jgi:hypothetical protein
MLRLPAVEYVNRQIEIGLYPGVEAPVPFRGRSDEESDL